MKVILRTNTENQIIVSWDSISEAKTYNLTIANPDITETYVCTNLTVNEYTLISLFEEGTEFRVMVSAIGNNDEVIDNVDELFTFNIYYNETFESIETTDFNNESDYNIKDNEVDYSVTGDESDYNITSDESNYRVIDNESNYNTTDNEVDYSVTGDESDYRITDNEIDYSVTGDESNYGITGDELDYNMKDNELEIDANNINTIQHNIFSAKALMSTGTPPAIPVVSFTSTLNSITLKWNAVQGASGYEIKFNNVSQSVSGTSKTYTGLTPGKSYSFTIRARNSYGFGGFRASSAVTLSQPPQNIRAMTITSDLVELTWSSAVGATSYNVEFGGKVYKATAVYTSNHVLSYWICKISKLTPNTGYNFKVQSVNAAGRGPYSSNQTVRTLLITPTNLRVTSVTTNTISMQWSTVSGATSYNITFNGSTVNVSGTSKTFTGLEPTKTYSFTLRAKNAYVESAAISKSATTLPPVPTNVTASSTANTVYISWGSIENVKGYILVFDGKPINTNNTSYRVTGLAPNTSHTFNVKAKSAGGEGASSPNQTIRTLLATPTNLKVTSVSTNTVTLQWDSISSATSYDVNFNGSIYNTTGTSRTFTGLKPDTKYTCSVRAKNSNTESAYSGNLIVTTLPPIPANIRTTSTANSVTISWDRVINATGYELVFDGKTINIAVSTSTRISHTLRGLKDNTGYTFKIRAKNNSGLGGFSSNQTTKTLPLPPAVPTNIRTTNITQNSVVITWNPVNTATSYDINFNDTIYNTTTTSRKFTGLFHNKVYSFSVRAKNSGGNSSFSSKKSFRTKRKQNVGNSSSSRKGFFNGQKRLNALDPIDALSGTFYWDYTFLEIASKDIMDFTLHYNSKSEYNTVLGNKWSHSYNYMLEIYDGQAYFIMPNGDTTAFSYNESSKIYIPDSEETGYSLTKTSSGYSIKHTDSTEYIFNNSLHLVEIKLNNITDTLFTTNGLGQITKITGRYGSFFNLSYTGNKISSVSDSIGNTVLFEYQQDNLKAVTNPDKHKLSFSYDNFNNLIGVSDFSGNIYLTNSYSDERVKEQNIVTRGKSFSEYDDKNKVNTFTDESGNKTKYYFDEHQNIVKIEHALGIVKNKYNAKKQLIEQTDELNNITKMAYDNNTRLTELTYPDGVSEKFSYNNLNLITKLTNADGTEINYTYDNKGNLISVTDERKKT